MNIEIEREKVEEVVKVWSRSYSPGPRTMKIVKLLTTKLNDTTGAMISFPVSEEDGRIDLLNAKGEYETSMRVSSFEEIKLTRQS